MDQNKNHKFVVTALAVAAPSSDFSRYYKPATEVATTNLFSQERTVMLEKERLITIGKLLVALATVWAIAASLYIFFAPVTIHSVTATTVSGGLDTVEESTSELSWYKVQGLWGSIVLLLFAGLYGLAARLAWRAAYLPLGILSVLALALTYLAGFSIGLAYLPAAIGLFIGALLLVLPQFPMPWNQPGL